MNWGLFAVAGLLLASVLFVIGSIGKPRQPYTPAEAVAVLIVFAPVILLLVLAGLRLT